MSTHPLEVPEILTRIGQFLPLWVEQEDSNPGENIIAFEHHTLLSSMQVSKLWYQTLLPILWFSYDGIKMSVIPQEVITRYSPYFRIFRSSGCHSGPFLSTHLVELTIYIQMMDQRISLETQKALIRANPRLRYLVWHGPDRTTELDMEDFVGLKSLQELRLFHWDGGERRLAKVLGAVKETIRAFEVSRIKGVLPGDLSGALHRRLNPVYHPEEQEDDYIISLNNYNRSNSDSNSDSNSAATMTETDLAALIQTEQEEDRLVLPYMEKIKVIFDRNPDYVELAQCCPNLKRLTVTGLGHEETYRLSLCLRDHCQKLKVLVLKDVLIPQEDAIQLLRSCLSAGGLTKIHMDVIGFEQDCISAILLHASTLEQLTIASTAEDAVDLEGVLRIMVKCEKLRSLRFMLDTSVPDVDVLEAWRAEAWACTGLEKLGLEFNYCEFGYEDYNEEDDEEEEEEEEEEGEEDDLDGDGGSEDKDKETVDQDRERREEEEEVRRDKLTVGLAAKKSKEEGDRGEKMIISSETPYMGWYRHPQESHDFGASRTRRDKTDKAALKMLFEMVEGFKKLDTVKWKDIEYSRSSTPPRCRHIK